MTPPAYRPPPTARVLVRRTAITLLVLAVLALGFGGLFIVFGMMLPQMTGDPQVQQMLAQIKSATPADAEPVFIATGGVVLAYAVVAAVLGVGLLVGGRIWATVALPFCCVVAGLLALAAIGNVVNGQPAGVLGGLLVLAPHALAIWWLLGARTAPAAAVALPPITPYVPMQEYYRPPVRPGT